MNQPLTHLPDTFTPVLACFRWLAISLLLGASAQAQSRFVDLFNGRDLSGWVNVNCAPETWSWRDGVVHCTGQPTGALRTERQYENFILELEWRHLKSAGNAGIFIWASPIAAPGVPFLRAIEVQVLDHGYGKSDWYTTHGDVFPIHGSTMKPFGRHNGMRSFPSEERGKGSPEWNHYRIVGRNGVLRLSVNGKEVSGGEQCVWRRGYLGLESEGSPVEFRNVRIQELPSSEVTAGESAPLDPGFRSLYTGLDLRGWRTTDGASRWAANGWQLTAKAADGPPQTLWTDETLGDGEWVVDCQIPAGSAQAEPAASLCLRDGDRAGTTILLAAKDGTFGQGALAAPVLKADAWHRFTIQVKGRQVVVRLDDEIVTTRNLPEGTPARGALGLRNHGVPVNFANLYWREK